MNRAIAAALYAVAVWLGVKGAPAAIPLLIACAATVYGVRWAWEPSKETTP